MVDAATSIIAAPRKGDQPVTEEDLERQELMKIRGVGDKVAEALHSAGYTRPLHLVFETSHERAAQMAGLDAKKCKQILAAADKWYQQQRFSDEEKEEHEEERTEFIEELEELHAAWQEQVGEDAPASEDTDDDADDGDDGAEEDAEEAAEAADAATDTDDEEA